MPFLTKVTLFLNKNNLQNADNEITKDFKTSLAKQQVACNFVIQDFVEKSLPTYYYI